MKIGDRFIINGEIVEIVEKHKGAKTNKPNMQSGVMNNGHKSKPCTYTLSNGQRMRGSTILKSLARGRRVIK